MAAISPTTQLPPTITPTLPEATTPTPSGLIVPSKPGGLIVVRHELTPVQTGSALVVATEPLGGDGALDAAKQAHAELARTHGAPAADIVHGGEVALATQVRNDEIRQQAIAALLAGDVARAVELIQATH